MLRLEPSKWYPQKEKWNNKKYIFIFFFLVSRFAHLEQKTLATMTSG